MTQAPRGDTKRERYAIPARRTPLKPASPSGRSQDWPQPRMHLSAQAAPSTCLKRASQREVRTSRESSASSAEPPSAHKQEHVIEVRKLEHRAGNPYVRLLTQHSGLSP